MVKHYKSIASTATGEGAVAKVNGKSDHGEVLNRIIPILSRMQNTFLIRAELFQAETLIGQNFEH